MPVLAEPNFASSRLTGKRLSTRRPSGIATRCRRLGSRARDARDLPLISKGSAARIPQERENFNRAVFALAFFSRPQDRELLGAISRGLPDCPRRF